MRVFENRCTSMWTGKPIEWPCVFCWELAASHASWLAIQCACPCCMIGVVTWLWDPKKRVDVCDCV